MSILEIVLLGSGLAMDASSVAMADGMAECGMKLKKVLVIATIFGIFQGLMPILGFYSGRLFSERLNAINHFIAFLILLFLGLKMIFEAREKEEVPERINFSKIILQGIATSIDALFAGVTLAIAGARIYLSALIISLITLALSFVAIYLGCVCGHLIKNKAQILGGIILILLGIKMLI